MNKRRYTIICVLFAALFTTTITHGQTPGDDVFAPVPQEQRQRLVERLALLVKYQSQQKWSDQFDMLSPLVTQGDTREEHVERLKNAYAKGLNDPLVDFTATSATYKGGGPSDVVIFGCASVTQKGVIKKFYASVEAYREKDEWYFSPIGLVIPVGGMPQPCPH